MFLKPSDFAAAYMDARRVHSNLDLSHWEVPAWMAAELYRAFNVPDGGDPGKLYGLDIRFVNKPGIRLIASIPVTHVQ